MRKALIVMIMAATAITPVAAEAQGRRGGGDRGQRSEQSSGEARAERIQERNERREGRQERQVEAAQPQAQPAPQPAPQPQVAQRQWRGGDDGNRGGRGDRGNDGDRGDRGNDGDRGDRGDDGNRGGRGGDGDRGDRGDRRGQTSIYPQAWQGDPNSPMLRHYQQLERRNQAEGRRDRRDDRRDRRGDRDWRDDRGDRGDRSERRRNWNNDWNRGWRSDRRYDWNNWRGRNRSIFRLSPYYSPYRGYNYRRFSIGLLLQPLFYSQRYWIGDPWQYRLPQAPYGTQWVRYYDDVLLVDVYSGEVVDVIYNFFW